MNWFPLALLATLMMTSINYLDKAIVSRYVPDSRAVLIFFALINLVFGVGLLLIVGVPILPVDLTLPLMGSGALIMLGNVFYLRAIQTEDASRIIVLGQLQPVVVLVLSVMFLGDRPQPLQLVGFLLILASAVGLSLERRETTLAGLPVNAALWLILLAAAFWGSSAVLTDFAVDGFVVDARTLTTSTAYASLGYFVAGVGLYLFYPAARRQFHVYLPRAGAAGWGAVTAVETTFVLRQFVIFSAIAAGPVALVSIVGSTNVFFGIVFGWALTRLFPATYAEDISRAGLLLKIAWAAVMFVGVTLLVLGGA